MNQPITMKVWAVVTPTGTILFQTISDFEHESIDKLFESTYIIWPQYEKAGYDCQQFDVTFKPKEG